MDTYEQKYKAALEWMQGMYGGLHGKTKEEAEKYFPELAESEDEKIEKEIIAFLKENLETGRADETWSLSGLKRWITWLEKLGYKPQGKTALDAIKEEKSPVESLGISPKEYEEMVNECIYGSEHDERNDKNHRRILHRWH